MLDLTRRNFLGTLIAIPTALLLPPSIVEAAELLVPSHDTIPLDLGGRIVEAMFSYDGELPDEEIGGAGILRGDGSTLLEVSFNTRANYCWVAGPNGGLVGTPESPLGLYLHRVPGVVGKARLIVKRDAWPKGYWAYDVGDNYMVPFEAGNEPIPV